MNVQGLQKVTQGLRGLLAKNSPTILTGLGVVGLISTTIMAVKATPKALQLLEEERYRRAVEGGPQDDITPKEAIQLAWRPYTPAALMGLVTIGCILGANSIHLRRNAALVSVYTLSEMALKEYQTKVVEVIGKNKERAIKDDIHKDKIERNPVSKNEVVITNNGETLCYDCISGRYFKSDIEKIRQALNKLSRDLMSEHFITLNEVYDALDLKGTKMGDMIGWHLDDGLIEPDFSSHLTDNGTPCLVLDYVQDPRYNNHNY